MGLRIVFFLALICIHVGFMAAQTNNQDSAALTALTEGWGNLPSSWTGSDPCGGNWAGISCSGSRIITITLSSLSLTGSLTGDLASLSQLQILDLSNNKGLGGPLPANIGELSQLTSLILLGCGFFGSIPDTIGSLQKLVTLSLNSNRFTGTIPATIGNLKNLYWLDLSDNQLTGTFPVSNATAPGLDLLHKTKHFHFGINRLSGPIPPSLFGPDMILIHVLFDNNNLTGSIPPTLGLVKTLEAVRFDRNKLNGTLPSNLNNLTKCNELLLSNNAFTGSIPDLTGMDSLNFLDMSNNSFAPSDGIPPWFSTLQSLTTVLMENTELEGALPAEFFSFPELQTVRLMNNRLNGSLSFGDSYSNQLQLIDLRNNSIMSYTMSPGYSFTVMLADNPFCQGNTAPDCNLQEQPPSSSYATPSFCVPPSCPSDQTASPNCKCAYAYTGIFTLRAPTFSLLSGERYFTKLQLSILNGLVSLSLPVDSVSLADASYNLYGYLDLHLSVFPSGQDNFNATGISGIGFVFTNQTYKPPPEFGPYVFLANSYTHFGGDKKSSRTGLVVGAVVGISVLFLLLLCAGGYAYRQTKRARKAKHQANPFVSWDSRGAGGDVPTLKGARFFTFDELHKCTNNFSEGNNIGSGGYGQVYRGVLADGQIVAIKRSQAGSMQGSREFKNEIELLSRVHHRNLVTLVGFCFDQGEQMLVYEFIPNGTLSESLSGKTGIQLDWIRRLKIVLGSARGLQYLHDLADPPIIHRDIKSNNILLDEHLVAKVADFGLSKAFGDNDEKGYMTTQVKGTMGYLDPEYFMTNQLTEKSDVFSFGVVMLEMVTARMPIHQGKYIVKEIKTAMDTSKDLYALTEVMDPILLQSRTSVVGFDRYVDLALNCVNDAGDMRPSMGEVVKEIEEIIKLAGLNPNLESAPTSQAYEGPIEGQHSYAYDHIPLN